MIATIQALKSIHLLISSIHTLFSSARALLTERTDIVAELQILVEDRVVDISLELVAYRAPKTVTVAQVRLAAVQDNITPSYTSSTDLHVHLEAKTRKEEVTSQRERRGPEPVT